MRFFDEKKAYSAADVTAPVAFSCSFNRLFMHSTAVVRVLIFILFRINVLIRLSAIHLWGILIGNNAESKSRLYAASYI